MVYEIPKVSVFGYFPLVIVLANNNLNNLKLKYEKLNQQ